MMTHAGAVAHSDMVLAWIRVVVLCALLAQGPVFGAPSPYLEVDVFTIGEGGYFCIKIPYLLTTAKGSLIAFAEARYGSCSDFTATDLVFKRSTDNGTTWSALKIMYGNSSLERNVSNVIGNAAPIQLRGAKNRILVPFCRNNLEMFQTWSDDDGVTWAAPVFIPNATMSGWQWVAAGPPGGLQLHAGRLVLPCYHSFWPHWTDGTDTRTHLLLNDDPDGDPNQWRVGAIAPGFQWTNECQAIELEPGHILVAARGFLTQRIQIESFDAGETLQMPYFVNITEPFDGCEGSIVNHRTAGLLFYSGTVSTNPARFNMTLWTSDTQGKSWQLTTVVNTGRTAYSSLVVMPDDRSIGLLYERSNSTEFIFLPTQISFLAIWPDPAPAALPLP
jgi:sialidase-1